MGFGNRNCSQCFGVGTMDKIISNNTLKFCCKACGRKFEFGLLEIKKKIIYLDQNIFSYASRKNIPSDYLKTVKRLEELTDKQLIISPILIHTIKKRILFPIQVIYKYYGILLEKQAERKDFIVRKK